MSPAPDPRKGYVVDASAPLDFFEVPVLQCLSDLLNSHCIFLRFRVCIPVYFAIKLGASQTRIGGAN